MRVFMLQKRCLLCIQIFFIGLSMNVFSQTLIIDKFGGKHSNENGPPDSRITIDFYPDGLIRSYREGRGDDFANVSDAFAVLREGNKITLVDPNYVNEIVTIKTFQLRENDVSIRTPEMNAGDTWEIHREQVADAGTVTYKSEYNGELGAVFTFSSNRENRIDQVIREDSYVYGTPFASGLPVIRTQLHENYAFFVEKTRGGKTLVIYKDSDGLDLQKFIIEGALCHSDPVTAILNYRMLSDSVLAAAIFPYIGGSPGR